MEMKFIKNINKYYEKEINLIDNTCLFIKLNNGIEYYDCKCWYINGLRHREKDKPAVEWKNGTKKWYINGLRHRKNDKPAIEFSNGRKEWYINSNFIKQNYDKNYVIHNDKFFDRDENEIH
jgi:hypothetical protein